MTEIVTLYNHKGGVSKTTTTFNLGHAVAEFRNKKILMVDADPQTNLTEIFMANEIDEQVKEGHVDYESRLPGTSLYTLLQERFDGGASKVDIDNLELVESQVQDNVFLLRGDIRMSSLEGPLANAHFNKQTPDTHQRNNYVAIEDALRRIGGTHEFDYIFIDVGPSSGALTRTCFLSADKFFIPTSPDRFNAQALRSLSSIISVWNIEHQTVVNDFKEELGAKIEPEASIFMGLIMQKYRIYKQEPAQNFRHWMDHVPEEARKTLIPSLMQSGTRVEEKIENNPTISEIPEFNSLAPVMSRVAKPVWRISKADTGWTGNVWDSADQKIKEMSGLFSSLSGELVPP